jgi:hypothetical protein
MKSVAERGGAAYPRGSIAAVAEAGDNPLT